MVCQEISGLLMRVQERFDLLAQFGVSLAGLSQKTFPFRPATFLQRLREDFFDAIRVRFHGRFSVLLEILLV